MKIWIMWAFSTWKTTLAKWLYNKLKKDINWLELIINPERKIQKELNYNFNNHTLEEFYNFQKKLIEYKQEINKTKENYISDTPVWLWLWYIWNWETKKEKEINNELKKITFNSNSKYDILFYLPIEFEIENDWTRHVDKRFQEVVDERIIKSLFHIKKVNWAKHVYLLSWDINTRINSAYDIIKKYLIDNK